MMKKDMGTAANMGKPLGGQWKSSTIAWELATVAAEGVVCIFPAVHLHFQELAVCQHRLDDLLRVRKGHAAEERIGDPLQTRQAGEANLFSEEEAVCLLFAALADQVRGC